MVWLQPPPEANLKNGKIWRANKAIYGLADGPSYFFKTLDRFLREDDVWGNQAGFISQPTEVGPCLYKITEYMGSNTGPVTGLMTTHVDDILVAAGANVVELVGRVLDVRFDQLNRKRLTVTTPFKHCGVQIDKTSDGISVDQRAYAMSLETLPRNKSADQKQLILEHELDGVRNKLGQLTYIT